MSLVGAIFNHKDDKKGQQDTLRFFFESVIGYMVTFPDTSNTRYQLHCDAATVLVLYQPLFIEFLELVQDKRNQENLPILNQMCIVRCRTPYCYRALCACPLCAIHQPSLHATGLGARTRTKECS